MPARILCLFFLALPLAAQQPAAPHPAAPAVRGFQVSGTVVHALSGEPVAGAEVVIVLTSDRQQFLSTVSDAHGRFLFQGVAAGKYALAAKHRGFPQQQFDGHGPFSTAIAVGPGKNSENLVFRLKPEGSLSGRITDEQDDPIRTASVMLFVRNVESGERTINLRSRALTDDQGGYHFGHLPAGEYYVAVSAKPWYAFAPETTLVVNPSGNLPDQLRNYIDLKARTMAVNAAGDNPELDVAYPTTYYRQATEPEQANTIRLNWGDRLTADITLRAVPAIHLRVASPDPAALPGFEEAVLKQTLLGGMETFMETQTVNVGLNAVEISGVAPGRYDLGVVTRQEKNGVGTSSTRHQTVNVSGSGDLDASRGSELAAISGTIVFEDQPAPPADSISLQFRNQESGQYFDMSVSAQGEFESPEIHPGRYDVVLLNAREFVLKSIAAAGAKVAGKSIEITGSVRVRLTLIASRGTGRVEGVVLRDGKPVAGAMIVLMPRDPANNWSLFRRDQSDSDGTFELAAIVPGEYTLLAIENGWELEWANPRALEHFLPQGQAVQVESGGRLNVSLKCGVVHEAGDGVRPPGEEGKNPRNP